MLRLVLLSLLAPALADEAIPVVDPKAAPISLPVSPDNPGPFKCQVDPFFAVEAGETGQLSVKLRIEKPGHMLYLDRIGVEAVDSAGLEVGELTLPPGTAHQDKYGGPPRDVYSEDTEVHVAVAVPPTASGRVDMTLTVFWQGCSDDMCFMPAEQTFNVPVRVKSGS